MDLSQRKLSTISGVQRSHDGPPTSQYGVSSSQSALCCSVLFTLFVVLNLIVINIFDLLCIWQPYLWKILSMVGASFWNVLIIRIPLFWDFPPSFKNSISKTKEKKREKKSKSTVLLYWCYTRFCVDNQWSFGLKSQTNKRYLRWRDLRCKEKYSLVKENGIQQVWDLQRAFYLILL